MHIRFRSIAKTAAKSNHVGRNEGKSRPSPERSCGLNCKFIFDGKFAGKCLISSVRWWNIFENMGDLLACFDFSNGLHMNINWVKQTSVSDCWKEKLHKYFVFGSCHAFFLSDFSCIFWKTKYFITSVRRRKMYKG